MTLTEAEQLAREFGCGWRIEKTFPILTMTLIEAQQLHARISSLEDQITELEMYGPHDEL